MKIKSSLIILIIVTAIPAFAQSTKYGGAFLELGIGPRALSLGGAYVAVADDATGMYWNPGGVAFIEGLQVSAMYANLFNSLENHSFASAVLPIFGGAVLSTAWIRLGVDDIPRFEDNNLNLARDIRYGNPDNWLTNPSTGSFGYANNAYIITFSKLSRYSADLGWQYFEFPIDIGYGVNFKMLDMTLDDKKATGLGVDAGVRIKFGLDDLFNDEAYGKLSFGLAVLDAFNTKLSWDTDSRQEDEIERNWRYGFAYLQPLNFMHSRILLAYDRNSKYDGSSHFGFEIVYKALIALRLGANEGTFTAGAGLSFWKFQFDYAYQDHDLGNSHRVGFSFGL